MAKVNLTQAAKLAGVGRSTLNRHIKEGKLSKALDDQGKPCVDTSELQRVYGELSHDTLAQSVPVAHRGTPRETVEKDIEIARLTAQLEAAEGKIKDQADRIDDLRSERDKWQKQAETLALPRPAENMPAKAENSTAAGVQYQIGWLDRLLGRKPL